MSNRTNAGMSNDGRRTVQQNGQNGRPSNATAERNARRMQQFNNRSASERAARTGLWADDMEKDTVEEQGNAAVQQIQNRRRGGRGRGPRPPRAMADTQPSTTQTPPKNDPLYDGEATGSHATQSINSHNLDFSGFAILIQSTYDEMLAKDQRLRRQMPFCAYQHYCVELLNAVIIKAAKQDGNPVFAAEADPFEVLNIKTLNIPQPIHEYLKGIGRSVLIQGDVVHYNLPAAGTPQHQIENGVDVIPSGTFGILNAASHNAYECYHSPYVSRALVQQTIAANGPGGNFNAWNPLPENAFPNGLVFTVNMLGYYIPERLVGEGLNALAGLIFADEDTMEGRLAHCPELINRVNTILAGIADKFNMVLGIEPSNGNSALFVVQSIHDRVANNQRLSNVHGRSFGPEAFGSSTSNKAKYFQMKRHRINGALGSCGVLANGNAPQGWAATCNNNYSMHGEFGAIVGNDFPYLRTDRFHEASLNGNVLNSVTNWLRRFFHKQR